MGVAGQSSGVSQPLGQVFAVKAFPACMSHGILKGGSYALRRERKAAAATQSGTVIGMA